MAWTARITKFGRTGSIGRRIDARGAMVGLLAVGLGLWLVAPGCSDSAPAEQEGLSSLEEFQEQVISPAKPAVVDFYADWCPPCRQLEPVLARLEREYAGKIGFFRVDVDRVRELAQRYDIRYLPTLVLFREGEPADRIVGLPPESQLRQRLEKLLAAGKG